LHALGVSHLLAGRYDEAAQALLAASREQPANARYLSDLATVQLERARLGLRPDDLPRALAAADRARRLDPSLREAWFNRALAASALSLSEEARGAWTEYLKRDGASPWATEARTRLDDLAKPTPAAAWTAIEAGLRKSIDAASAERAVRAQMTEARNFIETQLIPAWAAAVQSGQDASGELERLRMMAEAMRRVSGDALYPDAVAVIDRAQAQGGDAVRALAAAHQAYEQAAALFAQDRFPESAPKLIAAKAMLEAAGSPLAHRAAIDIAGTSLVRNDYPGTLALVAAARSAGQPKGYTYVVARASWFEGLVAFAQSRLGDTQAHYEDTLATFERMGDAEQVALANNLLAALSYYLGDKQNEWKHRTAAFQGLVTSRSARFKSILLTTAAVSLRADDPDAALTFHNAALASARESGRGMTVLEVLTQRSSTLVSLGREADAERDVQEARQLLTAVNEPRLAELYELLIMAPEGDVQRQRSAAIAVATADRALQIIRRRNSPADRSRVPAFQLQLAKANIVWGRTDAAKVALADGIRAFEEERALLADEGRVSTLDQAWQLFETSVQLAIEEKDYPRAFAMAERARARTLAEAKRVPAPQSLTETQAQLGASEAVVALNQFNDELAVWVIRRDSVTVIKRPLARVDAARLIARQQDEIWQELSQPGASRDLYNEVIRPAASALKGASKMVFVPDSTYQNASFAALWDASRGRFLVEDVTLGVAPSVNAYVSARPSRADRATQNPLILGGPQENADTDARAVAAVYPASSVLTGSAATRSRFLADAPEHSLVHVAARTATNQVSPLMSRLLLADEPGRRYSGAVLGSEIAGRAMNQTDLVVIDEVETNNRVRGEGTLSLARAFMAAGVPAVLGTLPGANEDATRDLLIGFHREMSNNVSAEQALSRVQRNAIQQNGRRLGAWTALVLYGSDR
jgi:CHAT domain-containing protein